ncbi:MAG: hypothetical protein ACREL3_06275 [Gemmatimonadales bacterium]
MSGILVAIFHDKTWWPPDDGNYAHVADRLLSGETLHADVQDIHAGYINFVNAGAFAVFGTRLVSLRYPLAILTVLQSGLMFLLLRPRGLLPACVGALAFTSLGFVQVISPTANWYCLFLAVCTICWLSWVPMGVRYRDAGTGFLLGATFLFRQLSGVLLAMGVLVFLLLEWPRSEEKGGRGLARAMIVVTGVGLAAYLAQGTDAVGWTLFGIWPFPLLVLAWRRTAARNRELAATAAALLLGAAASALPLIVYHTAHGSVGAWLADTFGAATSLPRLEFMKLPGYALTMILAGRGLGFGNAVERLNGFFWLTLLMLAAALGVTFLRVVLRGSADAVMHPLPVIGLFYSIVSVHYQITLYLFYTTGLCLSALLWQTTNRGKALRATALLSAAVLAAIAVYFQAGMPLSRGLKGTVAGERRPVATRLELDRAGIYVETEDAVRYKRVVDFIRAETEPSDTIFALPSEAELYFLAKRTNPFKFFNTALGIRSDADLDSTIQILKCRPPKLIFYNPEDKYNTAASTRIAAIVRATYDSLTPLPPFQVFRRRNAAAVAAGAQAACRAPGSV